MRLSVYPDIANPPFASSVSSRSVTASVLPPEEPAPERRENAPRKAKPERVLEIVMAEDDDDDFTFFQDVLDAEYPDVRLTRFRNGDEFCSYLSAPSTATPSLLVIDLNMPGKDGRDALREVRSQPGLRAVPIVVLTTSASIVDQKFVRGFDETSFVTKPSSYVAYTQLVKNMVRRVQESGGTPN